MIRAVWNTLQGNGYIDYPLPLKASDKLDDDLDLVNDADELEELVEILPLVVGAIYAE
ncbi:MAG: hypothetical protein ACLRXB_02280 [Escherichia coli]